MVGSESEFTGDDGELGRLEAACMLCCSASSCLESFTLFPLPFGLGKLVMLSYSTIVHYDFTIHNNFILPWTNLRE